MKILSNSPIKGTYDWEPEMMAKRRMIFSTWDKVCQKYGYQEYLTPILENADIYRAKSGEDIGGKELMVFTDAGGRELAIRPEMTPSVTRLVSRIYDASPKPLRLFSVANYFRNEKPQRGRNREFWQLNCDIFGSKDLAADLEILQIALDSMLAFNPPKNSFVLKLNNRKLLDGVMDLAKVKERQGVLRLMDKYQKLTKEVFINSLKDLGLKADAINLILKFITAKDIADLLNNIPELKTNQGLQEIDYLINNLNALGYQDLAIFDPAVIRGFDYYDAMVFEVFDNNPENNRAMFGGGRYNGLAELFGKSNIPAVGFAIGDETMYLFLESWQIMDNNKVEVDNVYIPLLDKKLVLEVAKLAKQLRTDKSAEVGLEEIKLSRALEYANRKQFKFVAIMGADEIKNNCFKLKDMGSGKEEIIKLYEN